MPPAADELLKAIFCNRKKGCGGKSGCRKVGLTCSKMCGQCHGQKCVNTTSEFDNIDELTGDVSEEILQMGIPEACEVETTILAEEPEGENEDEEEI